MSTQTLGTVTFLSEYGGRATDTHITQENGFISNRGHALGDQIFADRGFTLSEEFAVACNVELDLPSFIHNKPQLSAVGRETTQTKV